MLAERGDLDGLRSTARPADAGDGYAASLLAGLLAERGDLDELRARADAGDGHAAAQLAERARLRQGRSEEAERLRRFGLNLDGSIAACLRASRRRVPYRQRDAPLRVIRDNDPLPLIRRGIRRSCRRCGTGVMPARWETR